MNKDINFNHINNSNMTTPICQENKFAQNLTTTKPQAARLAPSNLKLQSVNWDLVDKCYKLDKTERAVLNSLLMASNKYSVIYMSQSSIADYYGLSREWVNKTIKYIAELGLIQKTFRFYKTCLYKISDIFLHLEVRSQLSNILYNLKYIPVALLYLNSNCDININAGNVDQIGEFTQYKHGIIRSINITDSLVKFQANLALKSRSVYGYQRSNILICKSNFKRGIDMLTEAQKTEIVAEASKRIKNPDVLKAKAAAEVNIRLTKCGLLKLMSFPLEAVLHGLGKMKYKKQLNDPYAYLTKICRDYCTENSLAPSYTLWDTCAEFFQIPKSAPMTEQKPEVKKQVFKVDPVRLDIKKEFDNWKRNYETKSSFRSMADLMGLTINSNPFGEPAIPSKTKELPTRITVDYASTDPFKQMLEEAGGRKLTDFDISGIVVRKRAEIRKSNFRNGLKDSDGLTGVNSFELWLEKFTDLVYPAAPHVQTPLNLNDNDSEETIWEEVI